MEKDKAFTQKVRLNSFTKQRYISIPKESGINAGETVVVKWLDLDGK